MKWAALGVTLALVAVPIGSWLWLKRAPQALPQVTSLRVDKSARELELLRGDAVVASYRISLGANPRGHKLQEGDERTPEGHYVLDHRNPRSKFHKSLHISYPNGKDRAAARQAGVSPGGDIMLHGMPNGFGWAAPILRWLDWTDGCVAVDNVAIEEIWRAVDDGTPIEIRP